MSATADGALGSGKRRMGKGLGTRLGTGSRAGIAARRAIAPVRPAGARRGAGCRSVAGLDAGGSGVGGSDICGSDVGGWNLARRGAARGRHGLRAALLAGLLLLVAGGDVRAQGPNQGAADLPGRQGTDPDSDPYPFDPFFALRNHFSQVLPSGWRAAEPVRQSDGFSVVVFVPAGWKGNPSSAMLLYCPQPYSSLWRGGIRWIELRPFYKKIYRSGVVCRPSVG